MKISVIFILLCLFSCNSLRGPTGPAGPRGPQGPQGEQGEPGEIRPIVKNGILYSSDKVEGKEYWEIILLGHEDFFVMLPDTILINCYVRKGSGYMWHSPVWYYGNWYIRIFDDAECDPGDEYIITAIVPD
jgi:hypothetical protein